MVNIPQTSIRVNASISLGPLKLTDRDPIVAGLNDREIYNQTMRIPYPYTIQDAESWLERAFEAQVSGRELHFAIRTNQDQLIGGCGLHDIQAGHRAEIGYWLARGYWGRGIMSAVVDKLCQHAFDALGLLRLVAYVFDTNRASTRVLDKCGFHLEGYLRNHFAKQGQLISAYVYGRLK